jgi:hypothetical protein
MSDYLITLDDNTYELSQQQYGIPQYNVGVNYEIPTKSTQYSNLRLDDISNLFDGTSQTFPLTVNGEPYTPLNEQQLIISIDDVVLNPGVDYQLSGSNIYFINPPGNTAVFFGVALATTADLTRTINFVLDNGSLDIEPGSKGYIHIDVTGTVESWMLVSETTGNIAVDIRKTTYSNFPNGFTSIVGSEFPLLINQSKNRDEDLTTWNKQITAGDILDFSVLSCSGIQKCSVFLRLKL